MSAIKRMGVLYGRVGLSTDPQLIERRGAGVQAAAEALETAGVANLLRAALGLVAPGAGGEFLAAFQSDPTFDVQPGEREAALLASAVAEYVMEGDSDLGNLVALGLTTAGFGGVRAAVVDDQLLAAAAKVLANAQGRANGPPKDRTYITRPPKIEEHINGIPVQVQTFSQGGPNVTGALRELSAYAEHNAKAAAQSDEEILRYVKRLEHELGVYWWVASGWSADQQRPYRDFSTEEASLRAGKELADKSLGALGLFAAPALINMVLERGRSLTGEKTALSETAVLPERDWRHTNFATAATGELADLLPISTALGLAAESADAQDWQPRFQRVAKIDPSIPLGVIDLGVQLYRERLLLRALS